MVHPSRAGRTIPAGPSSQLRDDRLFPVVWRAPVPENGKEFRRSDLIPTAMPENAIVVENLSKRYLIGHRHAPRGYKRYTALRDVIARKFT